MALPRNIDIKQSAERDTWGHRCASEGCGYSWDDLRNSCPRYRCAVDQICEVCARFQSPTSEVFYCSQQAGVVVASRSCDNIVTDIYSDVLEHMHVVVGV